MCGLIGLSQKQGRLAPSTLKALDIIVQNSKRRGQDASGLMLATPTEATILKSPKPITDLQNSSEWQKLCGASDVQVILGHARMGTNGSIDDLTFAHPLVGKRAVVIHNGILTNYREVIPGAQNEDSDSRALVILFDDFFETRDFAALTAKLKVLEGSYSFLAFDLQVGEIWSATNTGNLHRLYSEAEKFSFWASEILSLSPLLEVLQTESALKLESLPSDQLFCLNVETGEMQNWELQNPTLTRVPSPRKTYSRKLQMSQVPKVNARHSVALTAIPQADIRRLGDRMSQVFQDTMARTKNLRRCTRCVMPETLPYIHFDANGVCNFCHQHVKQNTKSADSFVREIEPLLKPASKGPQCIVAFSGGRDSSYSLHYIVKELGIKPLAFSYDWGMITDLGRRNQARMTGALSVEHALVAANIRQKREYIRVNIEAWLRRPHLGMIPLLMAGDKQYFYYAEKLKKEYQLPLLIMGENYFEKTGFKNSFAGGKQSSGGSMAYHVPGTQKAKMLGYYASQYLANPAYLNRSLWDTTWAFYSYFLAPRDYFNLFDYVRWDEGEIERVLAEYNWELSPDTSTTWRIGDGTAPFYNFIYHTVTGFTEIDSLYSNLIREGRVSREEGLKKTLELNFPRIESILWYSEVIGFSLDKVINVVTQMPRLYEQETRSGNHNPKLTIGH